MDARMVTKIAKEVIEGKWGKGPQLVRKLVKAGYDAKRVLAKVDKILERQNKPAPAKPAPARAPKPAPKPSGPTFRHPLRFNAPISCSFDCHKNRATPSVNPGTDYAVKTGTPVYAAHSGTVVVADNVDNSSGGIWVLIRDGNVETHYLHMSRLAVRKGQRVAAKSLIGYSGNTGASTGPHLHFVIRINGKNVDPEKYV